MGKGEVLCVKKFPYGLYLAIIVSIAIGFLWIYWNRNLRNPEDITSVEYCEDVIRQSYGPDTEQAELFYLKGSAEDIIDFENSFYLYSFDEKPIAIFYQFKPIGYAIYDFRKGYVKECNPEINHPFTQILKRDIIMMETAAIMKKQKKVFVIWQ